MDTSVGFPQTVATKLEAHTCIQYLLYGVALEFPYTGTAKGLKHVPV